MDQDHPALVAARNSWRFVQAKQRDEWLDLMADDVVVEDPIGVGPTNPDGTGIKGKDGLRQFWEQTIAVSDVRIETHESFAAGNESAHRMTLRTTFPGGTTMIVDGIFTYRVNDAGEITNLRGYWSLDDAQTRKS